MSYKELLRCKLTIAKVRIEGYKLAKLPFFSRRCDLNAIVTLGLAIVSLYHTDLRKESEL